MQLAIGEPVRVWDDDCGRWWAGEVTAICDDALEVTVCNGAPPAIPGRPRPSACPSTQRSFSGFALPRPSTTTRAGGRTWLQPPVPRARIQRSRATRAVARRCRRRRRRHLRS